LQSFSPQSSGGAAATAASIAAMLTAMRRPQYAISSCRPFVTYITFAL